MTHTSTHRGVEFLGDQQDHALLHEWFDRLAASEVKASAIKIKCREFRPYDPANFRIIILCNHPFEDQTRKIETAYWSTDPDQVERALNTLVIAFSKWVEQSSMPEEATVGERHAQVDWLPVEMFPHIEKDLSAQQQAQLEINHHMLDCLELIRLATITDEEFSKLWQGSNEPFFAAGRLIHGRFEWIQEIPENLFARTTEWDLILERVGDFSREYVGLIRLFSLAGAESPLIERVSFVIGRFKFQHAVQIPFWQALARDFLDAADQVPLTTAITKPATYGEIDAICDRLRQDLIDATVGLEDEIPILINALLPTMEVPVSAELFTTEIDTASP